MNWMHTEEEEIHMWMTIFKRYKSYTKMKNKRKKKKQLKTRKLF